MVAQRINEHFLLVYLELALAKMATQQQDWSHAFATLDVAGRLVVDKKSGYEWGLYQLTVGYCNLLQNKAQDAIDALTRGK